MKRLIVGLAVLLGPNALAAQDLAIDQPTVRACFSETPTGAIYPDCIGRAAGQCQETPGGSTTIGISDCILLETAEWDAILNEEYAATQALNAQLDDAQPPPFIDRTDALRDAQRAWIAFRDTDCTAQYAMWQDGTIRTIVGANCQLTMTAQRAIALRDMRGGER